MSNSNAVEDIPAQRPGELAFAQRTGGRVSGPARAARRLLFFLACVSVAWVLMFFGYYLRKATESHERRPVVAPQAVTAIGPGGFSNPVASSLDTKFSLDTPGFILQVAAMIHEKNADALAELLRGKGFSAFVIEPNAGRFYRVAVGPYSDVEAALEATQALRRQGFDAVRKSWDPVAQ